MVARPVEIPMPSKRMIAAVRSFVLRHPEWKQRVYREWTQHPEEEPYLTREKILTGYERGELPSNPWHPLDQPRETVDYAVYTHTGKIVLAWRSLDG